MSSQPKAREISGPMGIEPIEPWQILSVERGDEDEEPAQWGRDGRHVVAWFDLGEVREHLDEQQQSVEPFEYAELESSQKEIPIRQGIPRLLQWFRNLITGTPNYRLAGNVT